MTAAQAGELVNRHPQYCKDVRPEIQRYAELLLDWNRTVNLTGARTMEEVLAQIAAGDKVLVGSVQLELKPLPSVDFSGSSMFEVPWGQLSAAVMIATAPVVVLVLLFERRIVSGLTRER